MPSNTVEPQLFCSVNGIGVLSLPSSLCAVLPRTEIVAPVRDIKALAYTLEELLPLDAERMSVHVDDELISVTDGHAVKEWFATQESDGVRCIAAVPRAVLIAQGADAMAARGAIRSACFIEISHGQADVLVFRDSQLTDWRWTTFDCASLRKLVDDMTDDSAPVEILVIGLAELRERERLQSAFSQTLGFADQTADELEALAVTRLQSGVASPLVSFTNGPLEIVDPLAPIRRSIRVLALAAALSVAVFCGGLNWRANRYLTEASASVAEQEAVFGRLFPKQVLPTGILSRIESEHRRLAAMKGMGTSIPTTGSALPAMLAFWKAMPDDARYSLDLLHFTPGTLKNASGLAKSYADLEAVRLALVEQDFEVPSLSASQSARGVTLKLDVVSLTGQALSADPKIAKSKSGETQP